MALGHPKRFLGCRLNHMHVPKYLHRVVANGETRSHCKGWQGPHQAGTALPVTSTSTSTSTSGCSCSPLEISKGDPPQFQRHVGGARLIYIS